MAIIQTSGLSKVYHESTIPVHALSDVTLEIEAGEFTAVVGPSGSGKTTLLNIIGGLDTATAGQVKIGETEITGLKDNKLIDFRLHHIGFIFQSYNLIPVLTALENVEFIMLLQNLPKEIRSERSKSLLHRVGLKEQMNRRPSEMSGGQQQRVAVARALASKPSFVLADEPTANLDTESTNNLLDIMANLNREEGTTFLFSTHDQRVINRARRVITMEDGKIVKDEIIKK